MATPMTFYGRRRELQALEERYRLPSLQFVPVYGRRRVGKTSLLREFAKDKANVLYFTARQTSAAENLLEFSRAIDAQVLRRDGDGQGRGSGRLGDQEPLAQLEQVRGPLYQSFEDAFTHALERMTQDSAQLGRPLIIIDEYPYLAKGDPSVSSVLQIIIDDIKSTSNLMLILCGSSMSFMEHQVLGQQSPLYGRRTGQIKLMPLDAFDAAGFLRQCAPNEAINPERLVELYGIVGGIPLYLEQFDAAASLEENLARAVFRQDAFLYGEPASFLMLEVREPANYNAVLAAVASGRAQQSEIADVAGINVNSATGYLRKLSELQILERWQPVPRKGGGRAGYHVTDNLFGFWYAVTSRYTSTIEAGIGLRVAQSIQARVLPTYLGGVFEDVCRQWLVREMAEQRIDVLPKDVGKWWGTDPLRRQQADIDVAITTHDGPLYLGECKWTHGLVDVDVLRTLERRGMLFDGVEVRLFCFSRSGFSEGAHAYALERPFLRLVEVDEMFGEEVE